MMKVYMAFHDHHMTAKELYVWLVAHAAHNRFGVLMNLDLFVKAINFCGGA